MRHAPTATSRLRRAAALAPLLLCAWCAAQCPAQARPPAAQARPPAAMARPPAAMARPAAARAPQPHASAHELPASTVRPSEAEDHSSALLPIAVGLALTAIASYRHRGLPRGH